MKKLISLLLVFLFALSLCACGGEEKEKIETPVLEDFFNAVYEVATSDDNILYLETNTVDVSDTDILKYSVGLTSNKGIEAAVISESQMTSVAYSFGYIKLSDDGDAEAVKEDLKENIDLNKWVCVWADVAYINDINGDVFYIMSSQEKADEIYGVIESLYSGALGTRVEVK